MCGFVVFASSTQELAPRYTAPEPWTGMIRHRGPDGQRTFAEDGVAMHFARLAILDLSERGMQPMPSRCGRYAVVMNGEIVNHRELARRLGLELRGHSDTEVFVEAARLLGLGIGPELRGMFAIVLYDRRERSLTALRDPFGIKPLYYAEQNGTLILSSEIRPILQAMGDASVEEEQVIRFLRRGEVDDGEETLFRRVRQLPPGHRLTWKNGVLRIARYRDDDLSPRAGDDEEAEARRYDQRLQEVVAEYLHADVPVGVSLSGGFDSSLLAHLVRTRLPDGELHMFTRGYQDYEGNELEAARAVGERFGFRFHPVILSPEEVPSLLRTCSERQEHPVTSLSILAYHKLYREARSAGVRVLLEGHGGDELWAGYASYAQEDGAGRSHDGSSFRMNDEILLPHGRGGGARRTALPISVSPETTELTRRQLGDLFGAKLQRSLRFVDRASLSAPVEVRVPYLDTELALPALRWPDAWKIREGQLRVLVRRMARGRLGEAVALRPKVPIQDPQRKWLQRELREFTSDLLHSRPLYIEQFVDVEALTRYYDLFLKDPSRFDNLTFLAYPLFLEVWHQKVRGGAAQLKEIGCG